MSHLNLNPCSQPSKVCNKSFSFWFLRVSFSSSVGFKYLLGNNKWYLCDPSRAWKIQCLGKYSECTRAYVWVCVYMCIHVVVRIELRLHINMRPCLLGLCQGHVYLVSGNTLAKVIQLFLMRMSVLVCPSETLATAFFQWEEPDSMLTQSNQHWSFVCKLWTPGSSAAAACLLEIQRPMQFHQQL